MRLKKRLLAFSRRLHARIRKTRYMHKMRCLLINRRSLLLALRLLWKTPIFPSNSRFPRLCAKCLLKLKRLVSILPMTYFFSSRRRHTMYIGDWSSDVCSSDLDVGIRISGVPAGVVGNRGGDWDSLIALTKQIEALSAQVAALAKDVSALKVKK